MQLPLLPSSPRAQDIPHKAVSDSTVAMPRVYFLVQNRPDGDGHSARTGEGQSSPCWLWILVGIQTMLPRTVTSSITLHCVHTVEAGCLDVVENGNFIMVHVSAASPLITGGTRNGDELRRHAGHPSAFFIVPVLVVVLMFPLSLTPN